jgi:hypothetical protein
LIDKRIEYYSFLLCALKLPKRKLSLQKVTDRDHYHRSKDIAQRSIQGKGVHHEFDEDPVYGRRNQGTQSVAEKLYTAL